jgi:hypothetical protein
MEEKQPNYSDDICLQFSLLVILISRQKDRGFAEENKQTNHERKAVKEK